MKIGKLSLELMEKMLSKIELDDPRVMLGPRLGADAALIDNGDKVLVASTDPVTFTKGLVGWYAVHVNANDVAVMGATPQWFMATVLLPEGAFPSDAEGIFDEIISACKELGVSLIGGHTEVTQGLHRPIVVGSMLGEVERGRVVRPSGARPGDVLLLTKGIALEGTSIIAREEGDVLLDLGMNPETLERAADYLRNPGISVIKDARIACKAVKVHAMHDPTEGGLATALLEMAKASDVGLMVDGDNIPVLEESTIICGMLGLDPLGLLASGALLLVVGPEDVNAVRGALTREGVKVYEIGKVASKEEGVKLSRSGKAGELPLFERDEIARAWENLRTQG